MHADYAPAEVKDVPIAAGSTTDVTVEPGVKVTLRLGSPPAGLRVDRLMLSLFRTNNHPSHLNGYHVEFDAQGVGRFTIAEGDYYWVRLRHPISSSHQSIATNRPRTTMKKRSTSP